MCWKWVAGLGLALLPLAGGCRQQQATSAPPVTAVAIEPSPVLAEAAPPPASAAQAGSLLPTNGPTAAELENAAVKPVATEKSIPANIHPSATANEVIRLANSGVDENVMLAYVTNSASTFNLNAEEIIYLKDIGVPNSVVTAMIQRDQDLKQNAAAAAPQVATAPVPVPAPAPAAPAPAPTEVAPQATSGYAPEAPPPPVAAATPVQFYDTLSPYGTWVDVAGYGLCWQPTTVVVNPYWRPYFDGGHWLYTDAGWYWYSDYSWGWAPFHYGRWFRHHRLGWCWAPDTIWGPSWVSWRYSDDYCGWAPLPPAACWRPGFGFTYFGHPVGFGFEFGLGFDCFAFVGWNHFHDHGFHRYAVPRTQVSVVYNRTVVVNHYESSRTTVINRGIAPERVSTFTRTPVRTVSLRETRTATMPSGRLERMASNGRSLTVYQPRLTTSTAPVARTSSTLARPSAESRRVNSPAATTTTQNLAPGSPTRVGTTTTSTRTVNGTPNVRAERPTSSQSANPPLASTDTRAPASPGTRSVSVPSETRPNAAPAPAQSTTSVNRSTRVTTVTPTTQNPSGRTPSTRTTTPRTLDNRVREGSANNSVPRNNTYTPAPVTRSAPTVQPPPSSSWTAPQAPAAPRFQQQPATRIETPKYSGSDDRFNAPSRVAVPSQAPSRQFSTPTYQAPARSMDVPRSAPAPSYTPSQSYSSPRSSGGESRSAPAAPSRSGGGGSDSRGGSRRDR